MTIKCFLLVPSEVGRRSFRVFGREGASACPLPRGYHNAEVVVAKEVPFLDKKFDGHGDMASDELQKDPRWPRHCECGYSFTKQDHWRNDLARLYRREDTGDLCLIRDAPVGAMWFAPWMSDMPGSRFHTERGGGPHLIVRCPGGDWDADGKSRNGEGWQREGEAPLITAVPSIDQGPAFHGHLRNGYLVPC